MWLITESNYSHLDDIVPLLRRREKWSRTRSLRRFNNVDQEMYISCFLKACGGVRAAEVSSGKPFTVKSNRAASTFHARSTKNSTTFGRSTHRIVGSDSTSSSVPFFLSQLSTSVHSHHSRGLRNGPKIFRPGVNHLIFTYCTYCRAPDQISLRIGISHVIIVLSSTCFHLARATHAT
ncbi:hypothetical protein B0H34DRAFT_417566 [Crassisporium funariophilum]|nr:hypothetical protein B0H34DRAFT_417566 [Crassisporium funariophilum]